MFHGWKQFSQNVSGSRRVQSKRANFEAKREFQKEFLTSPALFLFARPPFASPLSQIRYLDFMKKRLGHHFQLLLTHSLRQKEG